eukprot:CAMPEP_0168768602 /NCGR_PEP_ID=MMETSP0725-20121227/1967_1 /TAXON_ID=265536 /ORGANISM="Amphiprora sp., Strain CCMP467" /LENGTH=166 /DNA_ID=CAMNT_0008817977 /DNA_START=91 /DNA_END=587 /DNA_ORIENTATION=-
MTLTKRQSIELTKTLDDEDDSVSEISETTFESSVYPTSVISAKSRHGMLTDDIKADIQIIAPSLERETSNKIREALPIGTLRFDRHKLYGREEQTAKLRNAVLRVKQKHNSDDNATTEFFLIDGKSGSGKTVLATSIQVDVDNSSTGVFLQGKFDLTVREEPYTAL